MPAGWKKTRKTFRHGHLAQALVDAAVARLKTEGVEALSLRELARDAGHRRRLKHRVVHCLLRRFDRGQKQRRHRVVGCHFHVPRRRFVVPLLHMHRSRLSTRSQPPPFETTHFAAKVQRQSTRNRKRAATIYEHEALAQTRGSCAKNL